MMNRAFGAYNGGLGGYAGCGNGFFGFDLSTFLLAGLVILAFYLIFRSKKQPPKKDPIFRSEKPSMDATEIVRLRYARGEISFEEFQTILKNIQS